MQRQQDAVGDVVGPAINQVGEAPGDDAGRIGLLHKRGERGAFTAVGRADDVHHGFPGMRILSSRARSIRTR